MLMPKDPKATIIMEFEHMAKIGGDNFRLDFAESREQKNAAGEKMYIQTRMAEYKEVLWELLKKDITYGWKQDYTYVQRQNPTLLYWTGDSEVQQLLLEVVTEDAALRWCPVEPASARSSGESEAAVGPRGSEAAMRDGAQQGGSPASRRAREQLQQPAASREGLRREAGMSSGEQKGGAPARSREEGRRPAASSDVLRRAEGRSSGGQLGGSRRRRKERSRGSQIAIDPELIVGVEGVNSKY